MVKLMKTVIRDVEKVDDVICNKCGRSCKVQIGRDADDGEPIFDLEYVPLNVRWGYGSDKDGEAHESALCEKCYDELVATFAIPPSVEPLMAWWPGREEWEERQKLHEVKDREDGEINNFFD